MGFEIDTVTLIGHFFSFAVFIAIIVMVVVAGKKIAAFNPVRTSGIDSSDMVKIKQYIDHYKQTYISSNVIELGPYSDLSAFDTKGGRQIKSIKLAGKSLTILFYDNITTEESIDDVELKYDIAEMSANSKHKDGLSFGNIYILNASHVHTCTATLSRPEGNIRGLSNPVTSESFIAFIIFLNFLKANGLDSEIFTYDGNPCEKDYYDIMSPLFDKFGRRFTSEEIGQ